MLFLSFFVLFPIKIKNRIAVFYFNPNYIVQYCKSYNYPYIFIIIFSPCKELKITLRSILNFIAVKFKFHGSEICLSLRSFLLLQNIGRNNCPITGVIRSYFNRLFM